MLLTEWDPSWNDFLTPHLFHIIKEIEEKINNTNYFPDEENVLRFLKTDLNNIRYIIVGMEPYPSFNFEDNCPQATGRSFEVSEIKGKDWNYKIKQSSLRNILKSIYYNETNKKESLETIRSKINKGDFIIANPDTWFDSMEKQGVLFLNSTLTVEANNVGSHQKIWEKFRVELINFLALKNITWMLWGNNAQKEIGQLLPPEKILTAPHPRLDSFIKLNTFQYAKDINWIGI